MKLNVKSLQRSLETVGFIYQGVKTTITEALNVSLVAESDGTIYLYAAGITGAGRSMVSGTSTIEGEKIITSYKDLLTVVSNAFTEEITITHETKNDKNFVSFRIGRAAAKCPSGTDTMKWDFAMADNAETIFSIENKSIQPKLAFLSRFCSNDDLRPAFAGVNISILERTIEAFATDGHRLATFNLKPFHSCNPIHHGKTFILDARMASSMANLDQDEVEFLFVGENVVIKDSTTVLFFRPPAGAMSYTSIENVINANSPKDFDLFIVQGVELGKTISRGLSFMERNSGMRFMAFVNENIKFMQEDTSKAWAEKFENLKIKHEYRFNPESVSVLAAMKGEVSFRFNAEDATKATIVENHEAGITMLFMPVIPQ